MAKKTQQAELNPVCLDCKQKCKQKSAVTILGCTRYRRKDAQLELKFTFAKREIAAKRNRSDQK